MSGGCRGLGAGHGGSRFKGVSELHDDRCSGMDSGDVTVLSAARRQASQGSKGVA